MLDKSMPAMKASGGEREGGNLVKLRLESGGKMNGGGRKTKWKKFGAMTAEAAF